MSMLSDNLKKYRKAKKFTQKQIADLLGVERSTYAMWETDKRQPLMNHIKNLAKIFNISETELLHGSQQPQEEESDNLRELSGEVVHIPVIGDIAGGLPIGTLEDVEYIPVSKDLLPYGTNKLVFLRVRGNSMEPTIPNGALALIKMQNTCDDGDIGAVIIESEETATLKRVYFEDDRLILKADNPDYEDIILYEEDRPRIFGIVKNYIKPKNTIKKD